MKRYLLGMLICLGVPQVPVHSLAERAYVVAIECPEPGGEVRGGGQHELTTAVADVLQGHDRCIVRLPAPHEWRPAVVLLYEITPV